MRTDQLIDQLAADLSPVSPPGPLWRRVAGWLAVAAASFVVVLLWMGIRRDLTGAADRIDFTLDAVLLLLTALSASVGALLVSTPGAATSARIRWVPVGLAALCIVLAAAELGYAAMSGVATGAVTFAWHCVYKTTMVALVPGVVLFMMVRRGAPLDTAWAGLLALLATAAIGVLGANTICPNDRPMHMLLWHVLPLLLFAGTGAALGRWLLRW